MAMPAAILLAGAMLSSCGNGAKEKAYLLTGGDPRRGAAAIARYGCGSCHSIPQIAGAHGLTGPPLAGIGNRIYVAGMLANNPVNIERWIRNPKIVNERTAMPNLGVTEQDAVDIAAYLYSLK
jgi:cytochrome c1